MLHTSSIPAVSGAAVDNFGTFFRGDAVGFVLHQSGGALAAWNAGFKAVRLDHAQRYILVQAGFRTWRAAFVKNKPSIHRTADGYERGHRGTALTRQPGVPLDQKRENIYHNNGFIFIQLTLITVYIHLNEALCMVIVSMVTGHSKGRVRRTRYIHVCDH